MRYLLPSAVFMLMVSIGMSLKCAQLAANWRRLTLTIWGQLLLATFIVPPLLAIALGQILPVGRAASAGLYLIAVSPGAPLTGHSSGHSVLPLAVFPSLIKCESILPFV